MPLIVLLAKAGGRYDADDVMVRKSTLEEVPKLLGLAASFALGWSALAFLAGDSLHLGGRRRRPALGPRPPRC